jgi:hypothetical protein
MLWTVAKEAADNWSRHKDSRQGAALAYYSVFSLGPMIVIAIAVAGFFFGRDAVNGQVASSIRDTLGDTGAQAVQAMLADAGRPRQGLIATLLGLGALIFAAIGVVVQLKDALNTVWEVEDAPGQGVWHFLRNYVVSLAAVLALGFLLMVSLLLTAGLAAIQRLRQRIKRIIEQQLFFCSRREISSGQPVLRHAAMLSDGGAMNSGPTGSVMVSRRIRSISGVNFTALSTRLAAASISKSRSPCTLNSCGEWMSRAIPLSSAIGSYIATYDPNGATHGTSAESWLAARHAVRTLQQLFDLVLDVSAHP